jgi:DNA-directed RNA polymerase subunit RPC12/RpoP
MAIFRCSKCGDLREVPNEYIQKKVKCPHCGQPVVIYDTVKFVRNVLEHYFAQAKTLKKSQDPLKKEENIFDNIDIYHTDMLTNEIHYRPVIEWFEKRKITVEVNEKSMDTTGFFDEIALTLGKDFDILKEVVEKIKNAQKKGYVDISLNLKQKSQEEMQKITSFCRDLYSYFFLSKYFYQKEEKIIRLKIQTIPAIVNFFNGEWMEWFIFVQILEFCQVKKVSFSCLRNLLITFPNKDLHEVDLFFLLNKSIPIYIECKSGEFRAQIEKYITLRKRIDIDKVNFLICILGLTQKECDGLSGMFGLTFVNEKNILQHIEKLLSSRQ